MRFGLVGTGFWAQEVHAPGVARTTGSTLAGVWGRDPEATASLAGAWDAVAHDDPDAMFADVDAVAFAVPPEVQGDLARRAAAAGCHLLLEKPIALDLTVADALVEAVESAGVSSVVFFTDRFEPTRERWLTERTAAGPHGGHVAWLGSLRNEGNPFAHSAWRQELGGLWDVGPHALSLLLPALGPVEGVVGTRVADDVTHLVLRHEGGASSTVSLSLQMPPAAVHNAVSLWDDSGWYDRPVEDLDVAACYANAVTALINASGGGTPHPCDVRFGREVVAVIASAEAALTAG